MTLSIRGRRPGRSFASLAITTPILLLSVGPDRFAIKSIADRWANAAVGDRHALGSAATALRSIDVAVLSLVMLGQSGLLRSRGVASSLSAHYGKALGSVTIAAGVLGPDPWVHAGHARTADAIACRKGHGQRGARSASRGVSPKGNGERG
ncbi:MAG: hypothetical protein ACRD12_09380, partial [Acidimicrobiales bacterium]